MKWREEERENQLSPNQNFLLPSKPNKPMDGKIVATGFDALMVDGRDGERVLGILGEEERESKNSKKRKSEKERLRQQSRSKKRMRRIVCDVQYSNENKSPAIRVQGKSSYVFAISPTGEKAKLHFLKAAFSPEDCARLSVLLENEREFWVPRKDVRRMPEGLEHQLREYFTVGKWCAVGHIRPNVDSAYWAKPVGDIEAFHNQELVGLLKEFSSTATSILKERRPDIYWGISTLDQSIFGAFHLFFGLRGMVRQHVDSNDAISFIFPLQMEEGAKGGLEIGRSSMCFSSKPGDAILLDGDLLSHGMPEYNADPFHRLIGAFVVQKSYLRLHGLLIDKKNILLPIKPIE